VELKKMKKSGGAGGFAGDYGKRPKKRNQGKPTGKAWLNHPKAYVKLNCGNEHPSRLGWGRPILIGNCYAEG